MEAAWTAITRGLPGLPSDAGYCLRAVRVVVEAAAGWDSHELYDRFLVAGTTRRAGSELERLLAARREPWASDLERSMKLLSLGVPFGERRPGDLVFNHTALPPYGHVGVLLDESTVVESIDPRYRPASLNLPHGSLSVTPLGRHRWTLVARLRGE